MFVDEDGQTVYKLYDKELSEDPLPGVEALKQLPAGYLHNMSHGNLNTRVCYLQYSYISGSMTPSNLRQFAVVMKVLNDLHEKNYVHGDIRKENLLFGCNLGDAWILDFDFSRLEDTLYPPNYNACNIPERHDVAWATRPMKKSHDLYALSIIIEHFYRHEGRATYMHLRQSNPDLLTIAQDLS